MQTLRVRIAPALDFTDTPPIYVRWIPVLLVAGYDAALATYAFAHVKVKAKLFTGQ
jgi:ABC-type proline/glycine betaine transport system permease subunit